MLILAKWILIIGAVSLVSGGTRLFLRALEITNKAIGPTSSRSALILDYLAGIYRATGRIEDAEIPEALMNDIKPG